MCMTCMGRRRYGALWTSSDNHSTICRGDRMMRSGMPACGGGRGQLSPRWMCCLCKRSESYHAVADCNAIALWFPGCDHSGVAMITRLRPPRTELGRCADPDPPVCRVGAAFAGVA
ncbi:hypothetical protein C6341_g14462 [Phytophthora cactorum]|nr:hypothetical protein C6341_g14462 [Phytophthora cactorum]